MNEKTAGPSNPQWPEVHPEAADPSSLADSAPLSHPIDESPEFHDPYSDLNLFLAGKVKEEFKNTASTKKWSIYVQEKLIEKIVPEFQKRFPHYRLGVAALKKIWEKIAYFSTAFENQKEALTPEGKLNVGFLIRENLKQFLGTKKSFSFHPYLLAQQLALKISECLAAYDGIRPMLQHITKTIWAVERHLIPPSQMPELSNPYDEFDKWDKLIIKFMLESSGKNSRLSQDQLQDEVRQALYSLKELPSDDLIADITFLLAETLYPETGPSCDEELLSALPASLVQRIKDEIINILIDNPHQSLDAAADTAVQFFIRAKELALSANWIEIEHKLTFWTIQGDLVYRCLRIEKTELLQLICEKGKSLLETTAEFHRRYPFLADFAPQVAARSRILSRYAWYAVHASPDQSTVDRFFEWQIARLQPLPDILTDLEALCKKQLPLLPFDRKHVEHLLALHQKEAEKNEGHAQPLAHR